MTAAPSRPDDTAQHAMRTFLTAARLLSDHLHKDLRRESGMTQTDYEVLAHLADAPDRNLAVSELARSTATSISTTSHLLYRLERRGWVKRLPGPDDRRVHLAHLTDTGHRTLTETAPWHAACAQSRLSEHLTDEQLHQLTDISEHLRTRLTSQPQPRPTTRSTSDRNKPPAL
ncbi:MarR family winged helix-turn-helix transcriptional regulator [Streptomyces sp. NBC_00690]|uniref:MarR family winged helix-turn-helix transcriptional regulator n=1 Tax=Streptomyces sp. NBC_00690 TaxID=2975808 RepID=UPI002E286FE7|nr:MarR family winged helix-turn-helix transcriptional regulator [Streptomyces sp. NBC_00690]